MEVDVTKKHHQNHQNISIYEVHLNSQLWDETVELRDAKSFDNPLNWDIRKSSEHIMDVFHFSCGTQCHEFG